MMLPNLRHEVTVHQALVQRLRAEFPDADEQALMDTIEGETHLDGCIAAVLREARLAEEFAKAIAVIIADNQARKRRIEARSDRLKRIALWAACEAGMKNITQPGCTAAVVTPSKGRVIVPDDAAVPDEFCKIERAPRKKEIGEYLDANPDVTWAYRGNPEPFWNVNFK